MLTNQFPQLTFPNSPILGPGGDFQHNGNDFYLGISAPVRYLEPPGFPIQEFGWVHLQPDGNELRMLGNAMSYNSPGIIVGTATLVPEPATGILAALSGGVVVALLRRRYRGPDEDVIYIERGDSGELFAGR